MRRTMAWGAGVFGFACLAIQLIPVDRRNPPVETEVTVAPELRAVLRRACYDCHSNETVWPWYSRIAPISWLIAHDVHEGRDEMNLSAWNRLSAKQQAHARREVWEEVAEGKMPPWLYVLGHPAARVSAKDKDLLREWSAAGASGAD